jgi:RNA polymerase subunit RPABC4/transcription elongation factor Spt4
MALISCPECVKEVSEKADNCPFCGFPIAKHVFDSKPDVPIIIYISEKKNTISAKCPKCGTIANIKRADTTEIDSGYKLGGQGECECGFTFAEIYKDNKQRCPKCGSSKLTVQKRGIDASSACCGAFLLGPLGLLCGANNTDKLNHHCLSCAYKWAVGS